MPDLTLRKRMNVVRLYFQGFSYQEIAQKSGVSKGSVVNIISMLKSGQFPTFRDMDDQVDALRELAVQLRRSDLSLPQAAVGLSAFQGIAALGVPPGDIGRVVAFYRSLTPDGIETGQFVRAALALLEAQEHTGKGPQELEVWVSELEERANALAVQCLELEPVAEQVETLRSQRDRLVQQIAVLTGRMQQEKQEHEQAIGRLKEDQERLETQVLDSQSLIGKLGHRYLDREEVLRQVEIRLAEATRAVGNLTELGLPVERLPDVADRLSWQAQHLGVNPAHFLEWFFNCLESAGSLLGLESQVKAKREQLQESGRELLAVAKKRDAAAAELHNMAQRMAEAKAGRRSIMASWKEEMGGIAETIRQEVAEGAEELRALAEALAQEVRRRQLQLGETAVALGRLQEAVNSYALVRPLASLLRGENQLSLAEARIASTALCLGLLGYIEGNPQLPASSGSVAYRAKNLLEGLEKWRP